MSSRTAIKGSGGGHALGGGTGRGHITCAEIELGCANDERLGTMRGMLELMARKKLRALDLLAAAEATESTVQDMRQQVSVLLDAHDRLAGGARTKMGTVAAAKRKLRQVQTQEQETFNVLSCCRSISQAKELPEGWRWSNNRAVCSACRATLHKYVQQRNNASILAQTVADREQELISTKRALATVGDAAKHLLDTAIYRPITLTSQPAADDSGHGIVFSIAASEHPVVITGIRCARHPWSRSTRQSMTLLVSSSRTHELGWKSKHDLSQWTLAGNSDAMAESYKSCLPAVSVFDTDPCYGQVPLKHPFIVEAGMHRSIVIHSDDRHGILNRHEPLMQVGQPSDSAPGLEIRVGMVLGPDLKERLTSDTKSASFVGQLIYRRVPRQ